LRLVSFPYAGGGASLFKPWITQLPGSIEIWAAQLPGREDRLGEAPLSDWGTLRAALIEAFGPVLKTPYALFGHSLGAIIAFDCAKSLVQEGLAGPVHLWVSEHRAPHLPNRVSPIRNLPDPVFIQQIRAFGGTPEAVLDDDEVMQMVLPTLRADFCLAETYQRSASKPVACPISAFGGLDDSWVRPDELAAWQMYTTSSFEVRLRPGDHFFLKTSQAVLLELLIEEIRHLLPAS
jgi:medium-chain acyl-[acyl-carrier-protein] hydrolase